MQRVYLSNLSPIWQFERQEMLLADALPDFPSDVQVFRDELDARVRQGRKPAALAQRAEMLRPTTRKRPGVIWVASLAVLAWTVEDMIECLTLALVRGETVRAIDVGLDIPPSPSAPVLHEAAKAFAAGRTARAASIGGSISGLRKEAVAREKAAKIKGIYGMPSDMMPWPKLLDLSGLTRNTIVKHLGSRREAQTIYAANEKRAVARANRKERGGE